MTHELGDAERDRRPERPRDDLVLRVRHEHELRLEDGGAQTPARAGAPSPVTIGVSGLARGRVYHYRLVATSDAGTSRGADQTFSTVGAPSVTTDAASSVAPTSARLNGRVTPNGAATSWYFEYGTTTRYGSRTPTKNAGSGTGAAKVSFSLTRPAPDDHVPLPARGGERLGHDGRRRPLLLDLARARRPHRRRRRDVGTTTATLTGTTDPRGRATSWWFEYGTTTRYGSQTPSRSAGSGVVTRTVTAAVTGLAAGETYHFRLVAKNDAGTSYGGDATLATVGVTLVAPALNVVYGRGIMLSGVVPTRRGGENVTLLAQSLGESSFRVGRHDHHRSRRELALSREAPDPDRVRGELEPRPERAADRRRAARDRAPPDGHRTLLDARHRSAVVRRRGSCSCSGAPRPDAGSPSSGCA